MGLQFTIQKGLNLPIPGEPVQDIKDGPEISEVGLLAVDYIGMKPTLLVQAGDRVQCGQPVFADKKTAGVIYTAPAAGVVESVNRAEKRRFESLVIRVDGDDAVRFRSWKSLDEPSREDARAVLVESGLWPAFRTRPFNRVPSPAAEPHSIFVTAMDTHPLSAEPELIVSQNQETFQAGLKIVSRQTPGKTFVCTRNDSRIPGANIPNVVFASFEGVHPAGLPGTHIHLLDPVGPKKSVWFINYQDVIAIGELFSTGQLNNERVVAVGGPVVARPGLYRTRLGARIDQLVKGQLQSKNARVVSGSLLSGRTVAGPDQYLGRYHLQVSAVEEGNQREFLGWQKPGGDRFSVTRAFLGGWMKPAAYRFNTNINGGHRSMVPIGTYERVMPLDILPTQLLRALLVGDTESAQALGCLELDEDDLGLCTYVCPGKYDYGQILRDNLAVIEKEG